jgi:hypothetical protein
MSYYAADTTTYAIIDAIIDATHAITCTMSYYAVDAIIDAIIDATHAV